MPTLLDRLSALRPQAKRTTLRELIADGRVTVNGTRARRASDEVPADAHIEISALKFAAPAAPRPLATSGLGFRVVREDEHLVVIDKPAGLLTSSTPRDRRPTALGLMRSRHVATTDAEKIRLVHRLDKDASGLCVFAKTPEMFAHLKKQFFDHTATRVYAALVREAIDPPAGTIENYLVEHADGSVHSTRLHHKGEHAITHYTTIRNTPGWSLLRVTLETGRKHQIRAHLAGLGHPIAGDNLYDGPFGARLMLAAIELKLTDLVGQPLVFTLPIPQEMSALLRE